MQGAAWAPRHKAIKSQGLAPKTITLHGYAASHRAVGKMKPEETTLRSPVSAYSGQQPGNASKHSHIRIVRTAAAFRRDPHDVLRRVLDIAGLAMHAVLRVDLQALGLRRS